MLMMNKRAFVRQEKCNRCQTCDALKECPSGALQEEDGLLFVGAGCQGCGSCIKACPYKAIELK